MIPLLSFITIEQELLETTSPPSRERSFIPGLITANARFVLSGKIGEVKATGMDLDEALVNLCAMLEVSWARDLTEDDR